MARRCESPGLARTVTFIAGNRRVHVVGLLLLTATACTTPTDPGGGTTTTSSTPTTTAPATTVTTTAPTTTSTSTATPTTAAPTTTTTTPPAASSWPTPETTGVVNAAVLTPWTGSCDLHTAGQVIEDKVFDCGLDVYTSGVTIRNSVIRGNEYHGVDNRAATGAPLVLEDVTFQPASGCWPYATAVGAQNLRATRVEITGFGDAFGASGNNVVFRDSYAKLCAPIGTEAHSDGLQGYLATAATSDRPNVLDHNTIDQRCHDWTWVDGWLYPGTGNQADQACEVTANVFWSDDSGDGLVVTDNLFRGGGFTIRVHSGTGHTVRGNVVERASYAYGPVSSHCASITWTNNHLADITDAGLATNLTPLPCTNDE